MRMATAHFQDRSVELMLKRQTAMQDAQEKLVSGRRVTVPSDDPTAAARIERTLALEARTTADQRSLEASRSAMRLAETTVGEAGELVKRARDLLVEAGNATYSDSERRTLSLALRGLREDLLRLANRGDGAGSFLFGGQGGISAPFVDAIGGVIFTSQQGQVQASAGEPLPMTLDGSQAFLRANTGNGVFVTAPGSANGPGAWIDAGKVVDPAAITGASYSIVFSAAPGGTTYQVLKDGSPAGAPAQPYQAGREIVVDGMSVTISGQPAGGDTFELSPSTKSLSIFDTLDRVARELGTLNRSGSQITQTVNTGLRDVDSSLATLLAVRSSLGTTLERTDSIEDRMRASTLEAQTERSTAEDLNMVEAVSDFQSRQTGYDAALKAYGMVQKLSLFDYLR